MVKLNFPIANFIENHLIIINSLYFEMNRVLFYFIHQKANHDDLKDLEDNWILQFHVNISFMQINYF